jgi:hypothetical protein
MAGLASNLVDNATKYGAVLASASAVSYACGYLVRSSRAHALGIDPAVTLLDQAYVLVGFRFALMMLIALLVVSPLLILVVAGMVARLDNPRHLAILACLGAFALAILTLASFRPLFVENPLLAEGSAHQTALQRVLSSAVLGSGDLGVFVILAATSAAAVTVIWAGSRYAHSGVENPLTMILIIIAALQLVLLPMQYGIFFADRTPARMLERAPEASLVYHRLCGFSIAGRTEPCCWPGVPAGVSS